MPRRANPVILFGLTIVIALSFVLSAGAQTSGGGSGGEALSVGEAQLGKPFVLNTDGPDTFSCVGLLV